MTAPRSASRTGIAATAAAVSATTSSSATPAPAAPPSSSFLKERERIITEIADGMEQLLGNVNTLNRKLEESVTVGQEFQPIANLWGPFVDMLTSHGLAPQTDAGTATPAAAAASSQAQQTAQSGAKGAGGEEGASAAALAASLDGPSGNRLPPGVAPGGGTVYGMPPSV